MSDVIVIDPSGLGQIPTTPSTNTGDSGDVLVIDPSTLGQTPATPTPPATNPDTNTGNSGCNSNKLDEIIELLRNNSQNSNSTCDLDELIKYLSTNVPAKLNDLSDKVDAVTAYWKEANITGKEVQTQLINAINPSEGKVIINSVEYDNFATLHRKLNDKIQDVLSQVDELREQLKAEIDARIKYDKVEVEQ
ncbi:hypothetical protein [Campylobacter vicugnae]|uniref:hypothetical protein n=1 Tax=Campylobacter vicugnae TaxID=1660076 RepID=UPI000A34AC2D|nr:hypothetical protein [Campylobacter sp. RM8835]